MPSTSYSEDAVENARLINALLVTTMSILSWLSLATIVTALFNTTFEVTLDNFSPSFATDYGDGLYGPWWVYDRNTGFFQNNPVGRSSGGLDVCFVAQAFRVFGEAEVRPERSSPETSKGFVGAAALVGSDKYGRHRFGPAEGLLASWNASKAMSMILHISHSPSALITIHNITIDVPVRTQAYVKF